MVVLSLAASAFGVGGRNEPGGGIKINMGPLGLHQLPDAAQRAETDPHG
ncbi:MAG: hypothetical protein RID07_04495 [Lacipirellulaceae bacterium]